MIRNDLINAVKYRRGKWNSAYIVGGYPLRSERERVCKELGAREIFIQADRETCLSRISEIKDRRRDMVTEWTQYIDEWFEKFSE